ncbi:MAG: nicotinamide-nucleotide amidohydrolase family protein [Pontimonas sp.]|nr:nicotinamide-nucleotide amidohydrolase family protein [Pontimonas sp.]
MQAESDDPGSRMAGEVSAEALAAGDPAVVIDLLRARGERVACAESLTGGGLCSALVSIAGASAVVLGGVVAYDSSVKAHLLAVSRDTLNTTGAVSEAVALEMARGVTRALGVDSGGDIGGNTGGNTGGNNGAAASGPAGVWGVSTTGVAGPDPDPVSGAPAGVVYIAVVAPDGTAWSERLDLVGSRELVRTETVSHALGLLQRAIESQAGNARE